jgi:hypothetical protein
LGIKMKVVSTPKSSPLEAFARWFHQDFFLLFPNIEAGGAEYLKQLKDSERKEVLLALEALLAEYPGKSEMGLRNAWCKLGAQVCPARGSTKAVLQGFLAKMPNSALHRSARKRAFGELER